MRIYRYRLRLAERYKTLCTISKAQRDISADAVYIVCAKSQFRVERYEVVYIYNFINIGKRAMLLQQFNQILAGGNILTSFHASMVMQQVESLQNWVLMYVNVFITL